MESAVDADGIDVRAMSPQTYQTLIQLHREYDLPLTVKDFAGVKPL